VNAAGVVGVGRSADSDSKPRVMWVVDAVAWRSVQFKAALIWQTVLVVNPTLF